jgi:hypothetical protein
MERKIEREGSDTRKLTDWEEKKKAN